MFGRSVDVGTDRSALDGPDGSHCAVEGRRGGWGGGARGLTARGERVVCGCLQRRTEHSTCSQLSRAAVRVHVAQLQLPRPLPGCTPAAATATAAAA